MPNFAAMIRGLLNFVILLAVSFSLGSCMMMRPPIEVADAKLDGFNFFTTPVSIGIQFQGQSTSKHTFEIVSLDVELTELEMSLHVKEPVLFHSHTHTINTSLTLGVNKNFGIGSLFDLGKELINGQDKLEFRLSMEYRRKPSKKTRAISRTIKLSPQELAELLQLK